MINLPHPKTTFGERCIAAIADERQRRTTHKLPPLLRSEAAKMVDGIFASELLALTPKKKPRAPSAPKATATDEDWIASLEAEPCLRGVDIRRELGKAQFWARSNARICTRKFFLKWIDKADRLVTTNGAGQSSLTVRVTNSAQEPAFDWRATLCSIFPEIDREAIAQRQWNDIGPSLRADVYAKSK